MSNPKVEKCGTCRGAAIDGEKLLGWIGNNGFGVRSLDYSLSTFRDALTKEIESGAFDIDLSDPTARRIVALHGELGEKEAQLNQALEALEWVYEREGWVKIRDVIQSIRGGAAKGGGADQG